MQQALYKYLSMFHIFGSSAIVLRTYCFVSITTHLVFTSRFAADLCSLIRVLLRAVAYPGVLFRGGSINSVGDRGQRERGSGGGRPLVRGSAGSCNLAQEVAAHMVKFS